MKQNSNFGKDTKEKQVQNSNKKKEKDGQKLKNAREKKKNININNNLNLNNNTQFFSSTTIINKLSRARDTKNDKKILKKITNLEKVSQFVVKNVITAKRYSMK